jgi:uncharacterized protein
MCSDRTCRNYGEKRPRSSPAGYARGDIGLNPLARVFAGELAKTTLCITGKSHLAPVFVTPGGATCSGVFFVGVLTQVDTYPGDFMEVWVADPTGMFLVIPGRQDTAIREALKALEPPVFVAVTGEVQTVRQKNQTTVSVRPAEIRTVDRTLRDTWIIRTAEITLKRLCLMKSILESNDGGRAVPGDFGEAIRHYNSDMGQIIELETMVHDALLKAGPVRGGEVKAPDPREAVLELIRTGSGQKGMALADLVTLAAKMGIREDQVLAVVRQLVQEDECYQPGAGIVKLL